MRHRPPACLPARHLLATRLSACLPPSLPDCLAGLPQSQPQPQPPTAMTTAAATTRTTSSTSQTTCVLDIYHRKSLTLSSSSLPPPLLFLPPTHLYTQTVPTRQAHSKGACVAVNTSDRGIVINPQTLAAHEVPVLACRLQEELAGMVADGAFAVPPPLPRSRL